MTTPQPAPHANGAPARPNGRPPAKVERVIDADTYTVQLALDPAVILPALSKALAGRRERFMLLGVLSEDNALRANALRELVADPKITQALTIALDPKPAEALSQDLFDAAEEPAQCVRCQSYDVVDLNLCEKHLIDAEHCAYSMRQAVIGS